MKIVTQRMLLERPTQVIQETAPLGPTGHLLPKATLPRLGDVTALPNMQKQTQRDSQNGENRNVCQMKGQEKENSRKRTK